MSEVNANRTELDFNKIFQRSFDESKDRIRVDNRYEVAIDPGEMGIEISAAAGDNIALADSTGTKKVDVETVGGKNGLDVNVLGSVQSGLNLVDKGLLNMTSSPVTTSAWTQVIASTLSAGKMIEVFASMGEVLILGFGAAGFEVEKPYILPGGNGIVPFVIPAGTRISLKSATSTVSSGYFVINIYG